MTRSSIPLLVLCAMLGAACHHIKSDYPAYLEKQRASPALPHVPLQVSYHIGERTLQHSLSIRSATAGQGNKWIVEFGEMLDQTLQSTELRSAFTSLRRQPESARGYDLGFELIDYQVSGFSAHLMLHIMLRRDGTLLIDKIYPGDGETQAGKVVWGGAFSMRHALHATTKYAVDVVLRELLVDIERATRSPAPSS